MASGEPWVPRVGFRPMRLFLRSRLDCELDDEFRSHLPGWTHVLIFYFFWAPFPPAISTFETVIDLPSLLISHVNFTVCPACSFRLGSS